MSLTSAGIRVWDPTESASIHGASSAQAVSINTKIIGNFADVAARDVAYTGLTSAQKAGIMCWITNRAGHCYWDPTGVGSWQWVSVHRILHIYRRPNPADISGYGVWLPVINGPLITLPPGNRLIDVTASAVVQNVSDVDEAYPRLFFASDRIAEGDNYMQAYLPPLGMATVGRSLPLILSGSFTVNLVGLNAGTAAGMVRFMNSFITITDHGPCDD